MSDDHDTLAAMLGVQARPDDATMTTDELANVELRNVVRRAAEREHRLKLLRGDERATQHEAMVALLLEVLGALHDLSEDVPIAHRPDAAFSRVWCNESRAALRAWRDARDDDARSGRRFALEAMHDAAADVPGFCRFCGVELVGEDPGLCPNVNCHPVRTTRARPTPEVARQLVAKIRARADALAPQHHLRAKGLRMAARIVEREAL